MTEEDSETNGKIGVGKCSEHGIVTQNEGATIHFPTVAECHCGRELDRATYADQQEVQQHI